MVERVNRSITQLSKRLLGFDKPTVWHEFTPLAQKHQSVNLGQGFPNWPCEDFVKDAAKLAIDMDLNQYARPQGHMNLVENIATKYSPRFCRSIDPAKEIAVTVGATEAIYASLCSILNEGDEVVIFEPSFDIYTPQVRMAGGVCRYVPFDILTDDSGKVSFEINEEKFANAFNEKTRVFILNTPHNPTGKCFNEMEMHFIRSVVENFDNVIVISDEVYEHVVFDSAKHLRFATFPGMWHRTLTISSAGKTFSVTGWKVGWAIGPENLIRGIHLANNWIQFSVATPLQHAVAISLEKANSPFLQFPDYYEYLSQKYQDKRDQLLCILKESGIEATAPDGGMFICCDISKIEVPDSYFKDGEGTKSKDWAFCRWLTIEKGVTGIPCSAFYCDDHKRIGSNWVRFAFCKTDESLKLAEERLKTLCKRKEAS